MSSPNHRLGWTLTAIAGVAVFVAFTIWGGIPTESNLRFILVAGEPVFPGHLHLRPRFLASTHPPPGAQLAPTAKDRIVDP